MAKLLKLVEKMKIFARAHKLISGMIAIVVLSSGYWTISVIFSDSGVTRYVLAEAKFSTVTATVTGSGQVSASDQVDLKSKVSGDILFVRDIRNSSVWPGTLIAQVNDRDAQKAVRDAEASLESAKIALEKLKGPVSLVTPRNKLQAEEDLKKAYEDGFNNVANAFLDLPGVMSGLETILFERTVSFGGGNQQNIDYYASSVLAYGDTVLVFKKDAYDKYQAARKSYDQNFNDYKATSRFSADASIETLIKKTFESVKLIAESVKSVNNLIQFYKDELAKHQAVPPTLAETYLVNLNTYTGTTNKHLLSLLNIENSIKNSRDALMNADLDIRAQELGVRQKENTLQDAKDKLADYYIRSPFTGLIAKINVKRLDSVGGGTVVATLITDRKNAELSLNEVDAAKIKVGQGANLSFDALEGLNIAGEVSEIDLLGTASQGVVTYGVRIFFTTDDGRVKPGMSVSSAIVVEEKRAVLTVPNSAVKSRGRMHFVELTDEEAVRGASVRGVALLVPPREQIVEVGLSDDLMTEIVSGLKAGDRVIARTIAPTAAQPSAAPSIFGGPSGARTGGAVRIAR